MNGNASVRDPVPALAGPGGGGAGAAQARPAGVRHRDSSPTPTTCSSSASCPPCSRASGTSVPASSRCSTRSCSVRRSSARCSSAGSPTSIGRTRVYWMSAALMVLAAIGSALAPNLAVLVAFRFLLGFGVGGDYPVSAVLMSEYAGTQGPRPAGRAGLLRAGRRADHRPAARPRPARRRRGRAR